MYCFDETPNRVNTSSLKWDVKENELPMWVADMDFCVCNEVVDALKKRLDHPVYGYGIIEDDWYNAYIYWWKTYHSFKIEKDWLLFSMGVVPTISSTVRKLTTPGENVLLMTPVFNVFFNSILNNGCKVVESKLTYKDYKYSIDWVDLENKLKDPQTNLMILCNPHNPVGLIFTKEELARIGHLAKENNVIVLSDEIHCDIVENGKEYTPFASVNDECKNNSITCIAATKAFNFAGIQTSAIVIPNPYIRHKVWRAINTDEIAEPNILAVPAVVAAFTKGHQWLVEFRDYIKENKIIVANFIEKEIPMIRVIDSHSTYLLWIDISALNCKSSDFCSYLREHTGLILSSGEQFGGNGVNFVRLNVATNKEKLNDGLLRLKRGILLFLEEQKRSI